MDFRLRSDIPGHHENTHDSYGSQPAGGQPGRLVVGKNVCLNGKISNCADLIVEGRVDAEMNDGQKVMISESGHFDGNLEAVEAEISGTFVGKLTVRKSLVLQSTARIKGELYYGSIQVQPGARIEGSMTTIEVESEKAPAEKSKSDDDEVSERSETVLEKPQTAEEAFGMDDIISRISAEDDETVLPHKKVANG